MFSATIGNILFSAVAANAALLAATELAVTTFVANLAGLPADQVRTPQTESPVDGFPG